MPCRELEADGARHIAQQAASAARRGRAGIVSGPRGGQIVENPIVQSLSYRNLEPFRGRVRNLGAPPARLYINIIQGETPDQDGSKCTHGMTHGRCSRGSYPHCTNHEEEGHRGHGKALRHQLGRGSL